MSARWDDGREPQGPVDWPSIVVLAVVFVGALFVLWVNR